ncbi:unnamed protein product [Cylindrotheca closterium]|uniref:Plastid lipid-associated protein/fibrillin conserved domain-containing protein n=1 Tax=Cylindrotheca closterium TaxID=2856 RepID=A0AAD2FU61_9STRA|nr:unnamed protein product [Cylindrotheca closterium]
MRMLASFIYTTILAAGAIDAFSTNTASSHIRTSTPVVFSSAPSDLDSSSSSSRTLDDIKDDLIRTCSRSSKPLLDEVRTIVRELEEKAEDVGIGQASAISGLLAGEWELVYSPEDVTRSSPFFWAFRQAFPDQSDEIFSITDAIPAPLKEVGPAYQTIELNDAGRGTMTGTFVSRVKVATLGGLATSMMTTRGTITGTQGIDAIKIRVETTKPEDSTAVKTIFGPLGDTINEALPPFPSGETLERVKEGSSLVVMKTTFCDEGLRISRSTTKYDDVFVWRRKGFASSETL